MWSKIAIQVAKYLATTEQGHKISKWLLLGVICFFVLVPVIAFAPISGFVTGVSSFFSGEEGDDLNDAADLDALLNDNFNITETKYYRQIEKARTRHINEVSKSRKRVQKKSGRRISIQSPIPILKGILTRELCTRLLRRRSRSHRLFPFWHISVPPRKCSWPIRIKSCQLQM